MIPFKFMGLRGKDFDWSVYGTEMSKQKTLVNSFITDFEKFQKQGKRLYIYSSTKGSGKTMLSCCLLNELSYRHAVSTKFVTVLDYIEMTRKGKNAKLYSGWQQLIKNRALQWHVKHCGIDRRKDKRTEGKPIALGKDKRTMTTTYEQ